MELKDSQSWKNMETALNAEALAYVTYTFFGQQARKDGYVQISNIFNETAGNELAHAKLLFKRLHDGEIPQLAPSISKPTISILRSRKWHAKKASTS